MKTREHNLEKREWGENRGGGEKEENVYKHWTAYKNFVVKINNTENKPRA